MSQFIFDGLHQGLGQVLNLRMAQHTLTATNLANADTPGFRAKFIPFDEILSEAVKTDGRATMRRTHSLHTAGLSRQVADPAVEEIEPTPWSPNGNSVVTEREAVRLKENATLFSGVTRGLSRRLMMMRFAATNGERG